MYVFICRGAKQSRVIEYLSEVKVDGLNYNTTDTRSHIKSISLSNSEVTTANSVNINLSEVKLRNQQSASKETLHDGKFYINLKPQKGKKLKVDVGRSDVEIVE